MELEISQNNLPNKKIIKKRQSSKTPKTNKITNEKIKKKRKTTSKTVVEQSITNESKVSDENNNSSSPSSSLNPVDISTDDLFIEQDSQKYSKKELRQHILDLPDSYIGCIYPTEIDMWVYDDNISNPHNNSDMNDNSNENINTSDKQTTTTSDSISTTKPLISLKKVNVSMGLYKIFDEVIQNAADNVARSRFRKRDNPDIELTTQIKVTFENDGSIVIFNNGEGIPVIEHQKYKLLIPSMIFGELLTSGNYDTTEKRKWGGKNGYGSKLCNIFSIQFTVETVDRTRQKKFSQTWYDNMSRSSVPKVTNYSNSSFTKITFTPDYKRFGVTGLTSDMKSLLVRRVYDLAGTTGISVFLNGKKLPIRHFQHFTELFLDKSTKRVYECIYEKKSTVNTIDVSTTTTTTTTSSTIAPEEEIDWEIVVCPSPDNTFRHVSYVNYLLTFQGGRHVDYVSEKIAKKLCDQFNEKKSKNQSTMERKHVRNNLWVFINVTIVNPTFSSQTKEYLTTSCIDFPSCDISESFYTKLYKTEIMDRAKSLRDYQEKQLVVKGDGKKVKTITGIPKLEDANEAGGKKSTQCTLILTEGDSARAFAIAGMSVVGRDYYGVYPLKGKPLNVRDASTKQVLENKEIQDLKKILGLKEGIKDIKELRYGQVMILSDQDVDGSHIKGLILNLFDVFWPEVLKKGFVISMYTPILKVKQNKHTLASFYSMGDYHKWKEQQSLNNNLPKNLTLKYYKGLGTSTSQEARECFEQLHKIQYVYDDKAQDMLKTVFDEKLAHKRKEWIVNHHKQTLDYQQSSVSITDFLDKEMITFSNSDNIRSIPCFMDGFKPAQRKVFCGVLKRNQVQEVKVSQLVGQISSDMCYHHGEKSMEDTIIHMSQNFVGTNNINLLHPEGQFGSRLQGGDDAARSRYIFTYLEPIARKIFRPEDEPLLKPCIEDGKKAEPCWYLPIIPMILVNGSSGIGSGFSTYIPNYNPQDLIQNIRSFLNQGNIKPLVPFYRKFKGEIVPSTTVVLNEEEKDNVDVMDIDLTTINPVNVTPNSVNPTSISTTTSTTSTTSSSTAPLTVTTTPIKNKTWKSKGLWTVDTERHTIHITELPLGKWTDSYKTFLTDNVLYHKSATTETQTKKSKPKPFIIQFKIGNNQDEKNIDFHITYNPSLLTVDEIETKLKLSETKYCRESNLHTFDPHGHLVKFQSVDDLFMTFCKYRIHFYEIRRHYQVQVLERDMLELSEKIRFIQYVIKGDIKVMNQSKKQLCEQLKQMKFIPNPHQRIIEVEKVLVDTWLKDSEEHIVKSSLYSRNYQDLNNIEEEDIIDVPDVLDELEEKEVHEKPISSSKIIEKKSKKTTKKNNMEEKTTELVDISLHDKTLLSEYKYLISTSVYQFTIEEIQKLEKEYQSKKEKLDKLKTCTVKDIWLKELEELENELVIHNRNNL